MTRPPPNSDGLSNSAISPGVAVPAVDFADLDAGVVSARGVDGQRSTARATRSSSSPLISHSAEGAEVTTTIFARIAVQRTESLDGLRSVDDGSARAAGQHRRNSREPAGQQSGAPAAAR